MEWNYRYDPAYDLQRILQSNIRDKAKAIEYGKRFRDFFIEGGWKELTPQPSPHFQMKQPRMKTDLFGNENNIVIAINYAETWYVQIVSRYEHFPVNIGLHLKR